MGIKNGEYDLTLSTVYDRGYGSESQSDTITVVVRNNEVIDCYAWGMHYVTELEVNWTVNISDEDLFDLIKRQYPEDQNPDMYEEAEVDYDKLRDLYLELALNREESQD
jgi:hypothetical protein